MDIVGICMEGDELIGTYRKKKTRKFENVRVLCAVGPICLNVSSAHKSNIPENQILGQTAFQHLLWSPRMGSARRACG